VFFILLISIFFSHCNKAWANDSLAIRQLLKRINNQQAQNDSYFPDGLFPSYREYYFNRRTLKKDDNSFFTGLIVFTLKQLRPFFDTSSQRLCDSIITRAIPSLQKFQNRKGRNVYSFWQTKPVKYFPNATLLSLFKMNALPDDADCSVIALMAQNISAPTAADVHQYMQAYTNNYKHKVQSTYSEFKNLPAYSTWLGHKVPIDFDVCVLSNILYFVHAYNLPYTKADSASLQFIARSVQKKQYMTDAVYLSPYYNKTSVILYHLARLMSAIQIPALEQHRSQLITDARECYVRANDQMDKVILSTALLKWNVVLPEFHTDLLSTSTQSQGFVFFVANMASMLPNPVNRFITKTNVGRFDYYCPTYNDVLILENLILRRRTK
jgi:hypothetical protein